jgi:protein gp37
MYGFEGEYGQFPNNWWLGVSVEDDERARLRLPWLLKIPTAVRWVSYEPALGPVDWRPWLSRRMDISEIPGYALNDGCTEGRIIGGESGKGARPFDLAWARDTIAQCRAANVPVFMKQMGAQVIETRANAQFKGARDFRFPIFQSRKGSEPSEWPEDLRVREWPRERGEGGK